MLTIAAEAQISKGDKLLSIQVSDNIPEGNYEVLVVLTPKKKPARKKSKPKVKTLWFPTYNVPVNPTLTFSRNEIYGEDGR